MIAFVGGSLLLVPLASALGSAAVPLSLRLLLVALWIAAVMRPHRALVAFSLAAPFGAVFLGWIGAAPVRYTEALAIATLSGTLIASRQQPITGLRVQTPSIAPAAWLFAAVVACSATVGLAVSQVGSAEPWLFFRAFGLFMARDYLVSPPGEFVGMADAARLLEGVGLLVMVARHARDGVMRPLHLMRAIAIAGIGAALLSAGSLMSSAGAANSGRELVSRLLLSRTSVHVDDVNAAGSYFAMAGFVALALAFWRPATARAHTAGDTTLKGSATDGWMAAAALLFAAVWFTGSRMAIVAVIVTLVVTAVLAGPLRARQRSRGVLIALAVAAAIAIGALALGLDPRPSASRTASNMVSARAAFMVTGLRMVASAPLFGVGVGRYFEMSGSFMPDSIYWFYFHENAHNNFLQIAGELGLVGLAAFVWLLIASAIRLARGLRVSPHDRLLVGASAGLVAFVATWMTSHPMLIPEVAYPFWILLAVGVTRADGDRQPLLSAAVQSTHGSGAAGRTVRLVAGAATLFVIATVPIRASRNASALNLTNQTYGFYDWEQGDGTRYRWTSRRATFFIPAAARELRLPLRAIHVARNTQPTEVSIAIGGRTLHRLNLATDDWTIVRIALPRSTRGKDFQRIDILSSPTWSPAALLGQRGDIRVLGVEVGEPTAQ